MNFTVFVHWNRQDLLSSPSAVQNAIHELNYLIHRYEAHVANESNSNPRASIIFEHFERYPMDSGDFLEFQLNRFFGQMYLQYCEVGKGILDVFFDQDTIVGDDNVRPLHFYSASFCLYFGQERSLEKTERLRNDLRSWLTDQGLDYDNPELCLGYATLAELDRDRSFGNLDDSEIVVAVEDCLRVSAIRILA